MDCHPIIVLSNKKKARQDNAFLAFAPTLFAT